MAPLIRAPEGLQPSRSGRCPAHIMLPSDFPLAFMSALPPGEFSDRCGRLPPAGQGDLPVLALGVSTHAPGLRLRHARQGLAGGDPGDVAFRRLNCVGAWEETVYGGQS